MGLSRIVAELNWICIGPAQLSQNRDSVCKNASNDFVNTYACKTQFNFAFDWNDLKLNLDKEMMVLAMLITLLFICIISGEYVMEADINYPSNDILLKTRTDHIGCEALCDQHTECVGFVVNTYDPVSPCWIKRSMQSRVAYPGINAYTRQNSPTPILDVQPSPSPSFASIENPIPQVPVNVPDDSQKALSSSKVQPTASVIENNQTMVKQNDSKTVSNSTSNPTDSNVAKINNSMPNNATRTSGDSHKSIPHANTQVSTSSTTTGPKVPISQHVRSEQNNEKDSKIYMVIAISSGIIMVIGISLLVAYHLRWKIRSKNKIIDVEGGSVRLSTTSTSPTLSLSTTDIRTNSIWQISNPSLQQNCFSKTEIQFSMSS